MLCRKSVNAYLAGGSQEPLSRMLEIDRNTIGGLL